MRLDDWFLTADERGNPQATIDRGPSAAGWSTGNRVEVLVDGENYFKRLYETLQSLGAGDWVHFTDWEGMPDERLAGPGTEIVEVLAGLAARGVHVRGLLWRSHPAQLNFSEQPNLQLTTQVNAAGGEILLDERVRRGGSHHQKLFVIRRGGGSDDDVAFVGGIDLSHGRHDDSRHRGDPPGRRAQRPLRTQPAVARRAARGPRSGGGGAGRHLPRAVGGPARRSTTATPSGACSGR